MRYLTINEEKIMKAYKVFLLTKIYDILNAHNIKVFLTCGTLLGAIRDNDFIEWDDDIDLACFNIKQILVLRPEFEKQGLLINIRDYNPKFCSPVLVITDKERKSTLHCDIFQFERTKEGVIFKFIIKTNFQSFLVSVLSKIVSLKTGNKIHIISCFKESDDISPLRKAVELFNMVITKTGIHVFESFELLSFKFHYIDTYIPSEIDDHLTLLYGQNWRIPNKNYKDSKERQNNIRRIKNA
jgi:hypothetical protein